MIIIDDLDRCDSKTVGQMMEALNFLMSAGDCFLVLAMDKQKVDRAIGWRNPVRVGNSAVDILSTWHDSRAMNSSKYLEYRVKIILAHELLNDADCSQPAKRWENTPTGDRDAASSDNTCGHQCRVLNGLLPCMVPGRSADDCSST